MRRLLALMLLPAVAVAQEKDPRSPMPERPTVATHAFTVARGVVELETGYEGDYNADHSRSSVVPVVFKIGLGRRMQLNVAPVLVEPSGTSVGFGDVSAGLKVRLADAVPVLGAFAVMPALKLATGDDSHGTKTTDGSVLFISSHQVGRTSLDVNAGLTWRSGGGSRAPQRAAVWTISSGTSITDRWGAALEVFGYPGTTGPVGSAPTVAVLAGPTLAVGGHAVVDAGGILRVKGPQPRAVYFGLTYNLGRL